MPCLFAERAAGNGAAARMDHSRSRLEPAARSVGDLLEPIDLVHAAPLGDVGGHGVASLLLARFIGRRRDRPRRALCRSSTPPCSKTSEAESFRRESGTGSHETRIPSSFP